jgi:hypothetical protein
MSKSLINDNAKKWLEALRSGKYMQGRSQLTTIDSNGKQYDCCLGVACKVAIENGVPIKTSIENQPGNLRRVAYDDSWSILPTSVRQWLGMKSPAGSVRRNGLLKLELTSMNDVGDSFEKIADTIEASPQDFFVEPPTTAL